MATSCSILDIPVDISVKYFPDCNLISSQFMKRALNYYNQGYVHNIKLDIRDISSIKGVIVTKYISNVTGTINVRYRSNRTVT